MELAHLRRARQRIRQPLGESGGEKRVAGAVRGNVEVREEPRAEVKVGEEKKEKRGVVVIGAAVVDFTAKLLLPHIQVRLLDGYEHGVSHFMHFVTSSYYLGAHKIRRAFEV